LRDELNEPLGIGSNLPAPATTVGAGALAAVAALVAAMVVLGETSLIRGVAPRIGGAVTESAAAKAAAPAEVPPLRLTASSDAPTKPPPTEDMTDKTEAASPAKPARVRAGAPEPLIIDVQQALAALRARDLSPAQR
jgi:hypothetical protein